MDKNELLAKLRESLRWKRWDNPSMGSTIESFELVREPHCKRIGLLVVGNLVMLYIGNPLELTDRPAWELFFSQGCSDWKVETDSYNEDWLTSGGISLPLSEDQGG